MNESLQLKNPCPKCGKSIKMGLKFCNYCGINLEEYDINCPKCGKSIKLGRKFCNYCGINLVRLKTDKIEITESLKGGRYVYLCLLIFPILTLFAAFRGAIEVFIILLIVDAVYIGFILFIEFVGIGRLRMRTLAKPRTFFISNELIKFSVPKKPLFQIRWEEFVKLEISERKTEWWSATIVTPRKIFKNLVFYTDDGKYRLHTIDLKWDFKKNTCIRIISILQQYCTKFNKEYSYTK